jgi:hypothetical protein
MLYPHHYKDMAEKGGACPTVLDKLRKKLGAERIIYAKGMPTYWIRMSQRY